MRAAFVIVYVLEGIKLGGPVSMAKDSQLSGDSVPGICSGPAVVDDLPRRRAVVPVTQRSCVAGRKAISSH